MKNLNCVDKAKHVFHPSRQNSKIFGINRDLPTSRWDSFFIHFYIKRQDFLRFLTDSHQQWPCFLQTDDSLQTRGSGRVEVVIKQRLALYQDIHLTPTTSLLFCENFEILHKLTFYLRSWICRGVGFRHTHWVAFGLNGRAVSTPRPAAGP